MLDHDLLLSVPCCFLLDRLIKEATCNVIVDHLQSRVTPWRRYASHVKVRGTLSKMDVTISSSLKRKQHDVIDDLCIPKPSRIRHKQGRKQYSFVLTFTNIFFTTGQEQTSLLNHRISTQRRPHPRSRAMQRVGSHSQTITHFITNN